MKKMFFMVIFVVSIDCMAMQEQAESQEVSGNNRIPTPICNKKQYAPTRIQSIENDILLDARHKFEPGKPHPKVKTKNPEVNA